MAIMIPSEGGYFHPASKEKEMFDALSTLPNDYYVFHSYRLVKLILDKGLNENEIDFLVFNPKYGCLFIECKNRTMKRENGQWMFLDRSTGVETWKEMHDPFDQVFSAQHSLFDKLRETYPEYINTINQCKFMVAIWLPKYLKREIDEVTFGPNIAKELIMTREAMLYPEETYKQVSALMERMNTVHLVCKYEEERIIDSAPGYKHTLSYNDAMTLFRKVLCPTFKAIVNVKKDYEDTYIELLEEQYVVLNFLGHQRTAAISGAGGTGKTLVAIQRARILNDKGERVLFLCYNRNLAVDLSIRHRSELRNVEFYTLDSFACKKCNTTWDRISYFDLKEILENEILEGTFEYKHIIVDEGQDFGRRNESDAEIKSDILELLSDYGSGAYGNEDTSFFIFYDKNQMVNAKELPAYLQNVDSKLTLYRNCRNTKNIAQTAYSLLEKQLNTKTDLHERAWDGDLASFVFYSDEEELQKRMDNLIERLSKEADSDRVIISCSDSIKYSALQKWIITETDGRSTTYRANGRRTRIFTCPTFKGLEADDVIVVDISDKTFSNGNCDFYVAASRAKKRLFVFIDKRKIDIDQILTARFPNAFPIPDKSKQLALAMHGLVQ